MEKFERVSRIGKHRGGVLDKMSKYYLFWKKETYFNTLYASIVYKYFALEASSDLLLNLLPLSYTGRDSSPRTNLLMYLTALK
jgi:hypothetical protein